MLQGSEVGGLFAPCRVGVYIQSKSQDAVCWSDCGQVPPQQVSEGRAAVKRKLLQQADSLDLGAIKTSKWVEQAYDTRLAVPDWSGWTPPPQLLAPPPEERVATLFQWQVYQEAQRLARVPAQLLGLQDQDGDTWLHIAAVQGRRALAFALGEKMAAGGLLDIPEHQGQTALQCAAAADQHLIVGDLLSHGARVDTRDRWGRTPLHLCAEKGHVRSLQSMCRTLAGLRRHLDPEVLDPEGRSPLHVAVAQHNSVVKQLRILGNGDCRWRRQLLRKKAELHGCVQALLSVGATCGTKEMKSGRTSVHLAAEVANMELLRLFLQEKSPAEVNAQNFSGNTPLHLASSLSDTREQPAAVMLLLTRGADPGIRNFEKLQPSQLVPAGPAGVKVWKILKGKTQ